MNKKGVSLIEILVVIAAFAVLGILVSRSVLLTVRGARKSEAIIRVRENINYAMDVIARQIRNAETISCASATKVDYTDSAGTLSYFECVNPGGSGYIASGSASVRLTSSDVGITVCSFVCTAASGNTPASLTVSATAEDAQISGIEGAQVTASTKIYLRTY